MGRAETGRRRRPALSPSSTRRDSFRVIRTRVRVVVDTYRRLFLDALLQVVLPIRVVLGRDDELAKLVALDGQDLLFGRGWQDGAFELRCAEVGGSTRAQLVARRRAVRRAARVGDFAEEGSDEGNRRSRHDESVFDYRPGEEDDSVVCGRLSVI